MFTIKLTMNNDDVVVKVVPWENAIFPGVVLMN